MHERITLIKKEQKLRSNEKSEAKKAESIIRRQKIFLNENQRKMEIKNKMECKLNDAVKRKQILQNELEISNILNNNKILEDRLAISKTNYYRNIEIYRMQTDFERRHIKVI